MKREKSEQELSMRKEIGGTIDFQFDFKDLKLEVEAGDVGLEDFNFLCVQSTFIGTIFTLTPSGKLYTPYANSNIKRCNSCLGSGCDDCLHEGAIEVAQDRVWKEELEKKLLKIGLFLYYDDADIFVGRSLDYGSFLEWFIDKSEEIGDEALATILQIDEDEASTIVSLANRKEVGDIIKNHQSAARICMNEWFKQEEKEDANC